MSVENLKAAVDELHLLKHPFYQDWMAGRLTRAQLRDYAEQYYFHVDRFPRYLSALHSQIECPVERREILENLNDEEGVTYGTSHPDLWLQFAEGLGLDRDQVKSADVRPAIRNVAETFFTLARKSAHEGLGAIYAYESQVPEIAHSKIEGLKANYEIHDERTLSFFSVHEQADVAHRESIAKLIAALPSEQREEAVLAARKAARALWDFLSDVHAA